MKLKPLLITLFCSYLSLTAIGQTAVIKGTVTTSDQQVLEFVNVGLKGKIKGAITDKNGQYEINQLEPGFYTLFASFVGVERQERFIEVKDGQVITVNFELRQSSTDLAEILVTDNGSNRFYADSSFVVAKLPLKDIENPQVYNSISGKLLKEQVVTNMNEALKNATGVTRLWESTGRGGDGAEFYTMRGFSVQPTIVNGMPSVNNGVLDPANIESIEVIKGPSGTLFGSPVISYGGLVNITTKKPLDTFKSDIGLITGNYGLNRLTADVNIPLNQTTSFRLNTAYQTQNSFQDAGERKSFFVAPSFRFKASERLNFLINTEFLDVTSVNAPMIFLNRSSPLSFSSMELFERNYYNSYTSNGLSIRNATYGIQAQAYYTISEQWTSQTVLSRSLTRAEGYYHYLFDNSDGDGFTRYISNRNGHTQTTNIQQNFLGDFKIAGLRNRMIVGFDYFNSAIFNGSSGWVANGVVTLSDGSDTGDLTRAGVDDLLKGSFEGNSTGTSEVLSAYVSDVLNLTDQFSVMASVRIDNFSGKTDYWVEDEVKSQTSISPKFGMVYQIIPEKVSLFANYMNGFVNIIPATVSNADGSNPRLKTFDPENANQYEFGIKTNLYQNKIASTISYYNILVKNRVMTDPENINNSIQGGEVESKGIELSIIANPIDGLNVVAGYSLNDTKVLKDSEASGYIGLRPEESGPAKLLNFWASYTFIEGTMKGFGLGFGGNTASEHLTLNRSNIGSFALPAYEIYNAALSYTGNQYFLTLKINNLTNQKYYSGWSTVTPQQLRNVALSLNYKF